MKSSPFHLLKRLNKFRPHNPFVKSVICYWHAVIAGRQCAPPMRLASGELAFVMQRIGDMVGKITIQQVCRTALGISKLFGKLRSGNRVVRCAAMRPEHCQIFWRNSDSITHSQQGSFELLDCRNRSWVAKFVHNLLQKQSVCMISNQFNIFFEQRNIRLLRFNYFCFGFAAINCLHDILVSSIDHVTDFNFFSVFGSSANQCGSRYASVKSCPHGYGWQYQCNYATQSGIHNAHEVIPQ